MSNLTESDPIAFSTPENPKFSKIESSISQDAAASPVDPFTILRPICETAASALLWSLLEI